mmetsp:Transcript_27740/g.50552  ORF Transcript_27740/g.50552 Transcript_27740/m.50552 type:complete len:225 (+) Transcript_27740:299-973(+)
MVFDSHHCANSAMVKKPSLFVSMPAAIAMASSEVSSLFSTVCRTWAISAMVRTPSQSWSSRWNLLPILTSTSVSWVSIFPTMDSTRYFRRSMAFCNLASPTTSSLGATASSSSLVVFLPSTSPSIDITLASCASFSMASSSSLIVSTASSSAFSVRIGALGLMEDDISNAASAACSRWSSSSSTAMSDDCSSAEVDGGSSTSTMASLIFWSSSLSFWTGSGDVN